MHRILAATATAIMITTGAQAACTISPVRGAVRTGGAAGTMTVPNTGAPCRFHAMADVDNQIPWQEEHVVTQAQHGTATATAEGFAYVPNRGYAGPDGFAIGSTGRSANGRTLTGLVTMTVTVVPP